MAGEWREVPIGQLAEIYDGPHATPPKTNEGPVFLGISNLASGRIDLANSERLSEDDYVRWTRRVEPVEGDVVFSYETRLGEAAIIPRGLRCCLGRRMGLLRARPGKVDKRFLLYAYLGPQFQETLRSRTIHGSTVDRIPLIDMPSFPIEVPASIAEQRAIAHVLGTLDDKIELNRRMSETLEAMARALFKSWFVDFDPVRAKAEGRDPGLPKPLADLFPARLVDSELGESPEGWEVGTLADLSALNPEVWTRQTRPPEINYVDLSNTKWGRVEAVTAHGAADAPSRAQRVLRPGDTIVGTVRPGNGSYALISENGLTGSTGFAVLRPSKPQWAQFVYLTATAAENIDALAHLADGGAYPAVRAEVVAATQAVRPDNEVLGQFALASGPLLARMASNERESRTLAALRDTLLPKLVSGDLRLKHAERLVADAGA
jgi:type I restriction enzyme S subunit